jgi:hypothetical protein
MKRLVFIVPLLLASCASVRTDVLREYYRGSNPRPGVRLQSASFRIMQPVPIDRMRDSDVNVWIGMKGTLQVGSTPVAMPDLASAIQTLSPRSRVLVWADRSCSDETLSKIVAEFRVQGFTRLFRIWVVGEPRYLAEEITTKPSTGD